MTTIPGVEILARFHEWADGETSVRATILTSSQVNPDRTIVDVFFDYNIEVYVDSLESYWQSDSWIDVFGPILVRCSWKPTSFQEGWLTRMVVYKAGFRFDFQLTDQGLCRDHYVNVFRVLLDKDGITGDIEAPTYEGYRITKPMPGE